VEAAYLAALAAQAGQIARTRAMQPSTAQQTQQVKQWQGEAELRPADSGWGGGVHGAVHSTARGMDQLVAQLSTENEQLRGRLRQAQESAEVRRILMKPRSQVAEISLHSH
jgi:hypothetical protein